MVRVPWIHYASHRGLPLAERSDRGSSLEGLLEKVSRGSSWREKSRKRSSVRTWFLSEKGQVTWQRNSWYPCHFRGNFSECIETTLEGLDPSGESRRHPNTSVSGAKHYVQYRTLGVLKKTRSEWPGPLTRRPDIKYPGSFYKNIQFSGKVPDPENLCCFRVGSWADLCRLSGTRIPVKRLFLFYFFWNVQYLFLLVRVYWLLSFSSLAVVFPLPPLSLFL